MIPPTKFQEAIYRFNTKLMHIWYIIESYLPHRIVKRIISRQAFQDSLNDKGETIFIKLERKRQKNYFKKAKKRLRKQLKKRSAGK